MPSGKCQSFHEIRWNETHIYGADNDTDRVQSALKGVLQRYVFFAEDDSTFKSEVTPDEQFVILNHSKSIPSTLRNVSTNQFSYI